MYSDMSIRISASWLSKRYSVSRLASSVLPTPVGPRKMNEPMGRLGSLSPARVRRIERESLTRASSCPITLPLSSSSMLSSLAPSVVWTRSTGTPVIIATTAEISVSVTGYVSSSAWRSHSSLTFSSSSWSFFSRSRSWAAFSKFWDLTTWFFSSLTASMASSSSTTSGGTLMLARWTRAPASSSTSIALSGRCRSVM